MLMAGRGFGKTRSGAEWLADQARRTPRSNWAVVAPTKEDLEDTCFEGESGLLQALGMDREDERYNKSKTLIRLDNGTVIRSYSAETPRKARGPNLYGAWLEEIAQWKSREMWDNLFPAIRRGKAQTVITTTPAPAPLVLEFTSREDGSVEITRGSTYDNEKNLSPAQIAELKIRWQGTRRERQELFGELLEDVPGALWSAANIEATRAVLLG
jgi:phage terminase large subunit-like protein